MIEFLDNNPPVVAGIFTIVGGILLRLVEKWLTRGDFHIADRKDYREEIAELHDRLDKLDRDVDQWRTAAHHLEEELTKARVQIVKLGGELEPRGLPPAGLST